MSVEHPTDTCATQVNTFSRFLNRSSAALICNAVSRELGTAYSRMGSVLLSDTVSPCFSQTTIITVVILANPSGNLKAMPLSSARIFPYIVSRILLRGISPRRLRTSFQPIVCTRIHLFAEITMSVDHDLEGNLSGMSHEIDTHTVTTRSHPSSVSLS